MSKNIKPGLAMLALALTFSLMLDGKAQDASGKPSSGSNPSPEAPTAPSAKQKPSLLDATRVSTEEAAQRAAQKHTDKTTGTKPTELAQESDVSEFHPAQASSVEAGSKVVTPSDKSKDLALHRVHGTVYGSTAANPSGDKRAGAAVGAASKRGKTAVYVETDHSRDETPH